MKLIRPIAIDDASLVSSSVPETDYSAWSSVTTYGQGERTRWVSSGFHHTYESMAGSNLGHHPEVYSTDSVLVTTGTRTFTVAGGLSFAAGQLVEVTALDDPASIMTGTVASYAGTTLGLTISSVTGGGIHASWVIRRPGLWLQIGVTNRWNMFDQTVGSQTENATSIAVSILAAERLDSVALLNIAAASVQVTMTDEVDGVVYDQTVSTVFDSGITDWYAYFFEPIVRRTDVLFDDLPPYAGATIGITLSEPTGTAACGVCVLGLSREIGGTQYGVSIGIQDYSLKQRDDFGNYSVLQRAFSKRGKFNVNVENGMVDALQVLLAEYRATPIVYVGADAYGSTLIYGFFKDFSVLIPNSAYSICDIEIEGLT